MLFDPKSKILKTVLRIARRINAYTSIKSTFRYFEHLANDEMYGHTNYGDCVLTDIAYIYPMSHYPKQQRNELCCGSAGSWSEGYQDERKCTWNQAYERPNAGTEQNVISPHVIPPTPGKQKTSSSWLNYWLGKDHTVIRLGVHPSEKQANDEGMIDFVEGKIDSLIRSIDTVYLTGYVRNKGRCFPQQI